MKGEVYRTLGELSTKHFRATSRIPELDRGRSSQCCESSSVGTIRQGVEKTGICSDRSGLFAGLKIPKRHAAVHLTDGKLTTITVPKDVTRFDALKVGDTLTATYYDNVVLRKKEPGEKDVNTLSGAAMKSDSTKPGGSISAQRAITATVTAIDPSVPSITLSGPNKWTYSSRIADKEALKQLKVGDRLDITWTEAVLISAEAPKK